MMKQYHLIDIEEIEERIDEMFKNLSISPIESRTIFKVNKMLHELNSDAYTPKMVSIGPYHKNNPQLDPMEKYKVSYLKRFLQRREGLDVKICISKLMTLKEKALNCYDDIQDNSEFCQMLLIDGCFVVEFIRERSKLCPEGEDRIIMNPNRASYIFRDLMLLDNQLPFFILDHLHHMTKQVDESSLLILVNKLFMRFANMQVHEPYRETECNNVENIKHLLHLVHIFSCHRNPKKESNDDIMYSMVMPNAIELSEAGVSFSKSRDMASLMDIKFKNGSMTIPCLRVEGATETLLQNLIAYEQQSSDVQDTYFSDYATFMDRLIGSDKDVIFFLRQKGIIVNWTTDDKEMASLFNKIIKGITKYSVFYYKEEFKKAVEHCEKPWNRMRANVKHNYFNKSWARASTVAGIILIILTTIQTNLAFTSSVK
ncbi:UPF0481 protein At3g47200-like [Solanum tuberosum]|uniref:Uncharacterized protein n=1 Tax=Solanum tuberosum TaxID=4113 RepID=M1AR01_SOLTU|nr:PREDICTED: UPF0481 protein At3g47200-like [Solanum tuberosum]